MKAGGRRLVVAVAVVLALPAGCARHDDRPPAQTHPGPPVPASPSISNALPDAAPGFSAGTIVPGSGFVRREYARGAARVNVTIAQRPMSAGEYDSWVRASAAYPPAALDVPPGAASGFYDCGGPPERPACSLHVQLRAGFHVEIMGGGTATRGDLDDLTRAMPLRALASAGN